MEMLDEAVNFIFDGCLVYVAQMKSHRLYRVFQASMDARDLQKLESEIRSTDLILGAVIGVLNNISRFVPPTEGHDSKPGPIKRGFYKKHSTCLLTMLSQQITSGGFWQLT